MFIGLQKDYNGFGIEMNLNEVCNTGCLYFKCDECGAYTKVDVNPYRNGEEWSDGFFQTDLNEVTLLQKCPKCGKVYLARPLYELPEGVTALQGKRTVDFEVLAEKCSDEDFRNSLSREDNALLLMQYIHFYSSEYRRYPSVDSAPYEQTVLFVNAILYVLDNVMMPRTVAADLYRMAGMFKKSISAASQPGFRKNEVDDEIMQHIIELSIKRNTLPFVIDEQKYLKLAQNKDLPNEALIARL